MGFVLDKNGENDTLCPVMGIQLQQMDQLGQALMELSERLNNKVDTGMYHSESAIGDGNVDHVVSLGEQQMALEAVLE
eukprot:13681210-Ditylum_brightwellii.AAC.1